MWAGGVNIDCCRFLFVAGVAAFLAGCSNSEDQRAEQSVVEEPSRQINADRAIVEAPVDASQAPLETGQTSANSTMHPIEFEALAAMAAVEDNSELERDALRCASGEVEIGSEFCRQVAESIAPTGPTIAVTSASSTSCARQAEDIALRLCVNFVMRAFDNRMTLDSTTEASKLPRSCEPRHAEQAFGGYDAGNAVLERFIGQQNVTEANVRTACASRIGR